MNTTEILGKEVFDASANRVGRVIDIEFDFPQGVVKDFVIRAGLTKKYVVTIDKVDKIGEKMILGITQKELESSNKKQPV